MPEFTLCHIDDVAENNSRGFNPGTTGTHEAAVFAVKQRDHIYIYKNQCPHLGLPLEWMPHQFLDRDGQYIQCATHGALFSIATGNCVSGPCLGETLTSIPYAIREKSIIIDSQYLENQT